MIENTYYNLGHRVLCTFVYSLGVFNHNPNTASYIIRTRQVFSTVVVVVLTLTRIIKSVVTGQAPVTLELRNTPGKTLHNPRNRA